MPSPTDGQKRQTSRRWANEPAERGGVVSFRPALDYMLQCLSGDPNARADRPDWLEHWLVSTFLADRIPVDRCLSLCCTTGVRERHLADLGVFRRCTGMDISEGALLKARALAKEAGLDTIDYQVADLDRVELEPESYDVVFALGALHHISELEHLVSQIHKALKPGGLLIDHDYIGPNYGNLSFRHCEIINAVMHLIPRRLRRTTEHIFLPARWGYPRWKRCLYEAWRLATLRPSTIDFEGHPPSPTWPRPAKRLYQALAALNRSLLARTPRRFRFGKLFDRSPEAVKALDASEGIRSAEIIPVIQSVFRDVTIRYANWPLVHYAFDADFFRNYREDSEEDRAILDLVIAIEKTMIREGDVRPVLATCVARKE
jgi:SAM-dependent methyltransferase